MRIRRLILGAGLTLGLVALLSSWGVEAQPRAGQVGATVREHILLNVNQLRWTPGPAVLGPNTMVATIEGDPARPNALFTMRARLPNGWRIAPHTHPADEHVTVLQGNLLMGMGNQVDRSRARSLTAGGFAVMPKDTQHYAFAEGETIIQLHGVGPWQINFVNPADDPRRQSAAPEPDQPPAKRQ